MTKGQPHSDIPADIDGVRTRIVSGDLFAQRGSLSAEQTADLEKSVAGPELVYPISPAEVARVKSVQTAHSAELLKKAGVQALGITSSLDSPGDGALLVYLIRGVAHDPVPAVIDGVRTRVREGGPFRAGFGGRIPQTSCKVLPQRGSKVAATVSKHPKP